MNNRNTLAGKVEDLMVQVFSTYTNLLALKPLHFSENQDYEKNALVVQANARDKGLHGVKGVLLWEVQVTVTYRSKIKVTTSEEADASWKAVVGVIDDMKALGTQVPALALFNAWFWKNDDSDTRDEKDVWRTWKRTFSILAKEKP